MYNIYVFQLNRRSSYSTESQKIRVGNPFAMKECYYAILGIERKADEDAIKKAYRQMALKHHPDKQAGENRDDATAKFQLISEAYEVLSNKQERAWYDDHRDQILRGSDRPSGGGETHSTKEDIWRYFSTSSFGGRYDDSEGGFYKTYRKLFEDLSRLETDDNDSSSDSESESRQSMLRSFGDSKSEWDDVQAFYSQWSNFQSNRRFWDFDKWDLREGENRQIRRAMEVENKKARNAARKEFSSAVRSLVAFVKRRDGRVIEFQTKQAERERAAKEENMRVAKEKEEKKRMARETAREEEMLRWAEVERMKRENGEWLSSSSKSSGESGDEAKVLECVACKKVFKSENAFANHEVSKKHKQQIAKLRAELMLSDDEKSEEEVYEPVQYKASKKKSNKKVQIFGTDMAGIDEDLPSHKTNKTHIIVPDLPEIEKQFEIIEKSPEVLIAAEEVKRRRRRAEKKSAKPDSFTCKTCSENYPSKSALFRHLESSGHHALLR